MSGCTGACCAAFPLSVDLDYLWLNAHRIRDGQQIAAMLIPLEPGQARARLQRVDSPMEVHTATEYFTCRHWHPATRRCLIYDDRPHMCRVYPGPRGEGCDHGCPHVETLRP